MLGNYHEKEKVDTLPIWHISCQNLGFAHHRFINNPAPDYLNLIFLTRPALDRRVLAFFFGGNMDKTLIR